MYLKSASWLLFDRLVRIFGGLFIGIWIAMIMVIIGIASVFTDVGLGGAHSAEKSTPCSLFFCLLFQHRYWFSKDRIKEEAVIEVKYISDVLIPNLEDALALNFNVN
jgi:hypothetical protein